MNTNKDFNFFLRFVLQYQSDVSELGQTFPQSKISFSKPSYKDGYNSYFLENEKDTSYHPNKVLASSHLEKRILNSLKPNVDRQLGIFNQLGIFDTAGTLVRITCLS